MMYAGLLTHRSKLISDKTMVIGGKVSNFAAIYIRTYKK